MDTNEVNEPPQERPHVERAEDLLNRLGQRFTQSRAQFSQALEQRAARTNGNGATPDTRPAAVRAEEMLDRAGERIGAFASTAGHQMRRWLALAREEAEDILAEAQSVSHRNATGSNATISDISVPPAHAEEPPENVGEPE